MKTESILITGGAGYIGSVLSENLLNNGYNVTVFDNLGFGPQSLMHLITNEKFKFVFGDVRDTEHLKKVVPKFDAILPLAAIVGAPQCSKNSVDANFVNRESIINLNNIRSSSQKLIYPNTNSGYGATTGEVFCTEETPLNPISLYGITKCQAEKSLFDSDKPFVSLRLATAFGMSPRMRTDLLANHFVYKAVTDGCLVVYEKDFKRNFVHVRDIADCFMHSIENFYDMAGEAYNLGLDKANVSKKELAEKIKIFVPKFDVTYKEIGSDVDKRNYIVSNEKLKKAGFEGKFDLNYGIDELVKGYDLMFSKEVFRQ